MRALPKGLLGFATFSFAVVLAGRAPAQAAAENPDEITVRGGKTLGEYRLELERARDEVFRRFNEANKGDDTDIACNDEQPTGSRMRQNVCRSAAENRADANSARDFLNALLISAGNYVTGVPNSPPGSLINSTIATGVAQADGVTGQGDALAKFEQEWNRLLRDDQDFYRAVVEYVELENQYDSVRGVAELTVPTVAITAGQPSGPQCEATTLTEYFQRNDIARVSGTISISVCPAGTTGSYAVVARVRDEAGEIRPIEFNETWQRDDASDVAFNKDYPIGADVELVNVRVRGLKCTCAELAQAAPQ